MRTHKAVALLGAAVLSLSLAACGGDDDSTDAGATTTPTDAAPTFEAGSTMATLSEKGSVTVGTKFDQPLFGLKGLDGKPAGFDVEIAEIIASGLGIDAESITWVETPSAVREEKIEQAAVDYVVATYTINDKRKERISFAGPYYEAGQALMVKTGNPKGIDGPESLKTAGAKVCSVSGSTPSENIKQYLGAPEELVLFDVYSKCADALRTGQVDVVTTDNVILLGLVSANEADFELLEGTFTQEPYGIGVKKGDVAFCEYINETLTKASEDGAYEQAWADTAGKVDSTVPELPTLGACT
jgi:glutamate transport system substrate-binding protein